jgi:hypothetical protein
MGNGVNSLKAILFDVRPNSWMRLRSIDFQRGVEGFDSLFEAHAVRENDQTCTEAGGYFNDTDDPIVLN